MWSFQPALFLNYEKAQLELLHDYSTTLSFLKRTLFLTQTLSASKYLAPTMLLQQNNKGCFSPFYTSCSCKGEMQVSVLEAMNVWSLPWYNWETISSFLQDRHTVAGSPCETAIHVMWNSNTASLQFIIQETSNSLNRCTEPLAFQVSWSTTSINLTQHGKL